MEQINKIKLDQIDKRIISEIEKNARIPLTLLAKKVHVSRTIAEYRLQQLEEKKIIRGYYALLDPSKFGLTVWKLWISLNTTKQDKKDKVFSYLEKHPRIWWFAECAGVYDTVICVLCKNPHEFNQFFNEIQDKFGEYMRDSAILINVSFEYHTRGYLFNKPAQMIESSFQEKPNINKISDDAIAVLKQVCSNARISYAQLAEKTQRNAKTIKKTLVELKKTGVIVYFRPSIDVTKLGYEYYKVLLYLHNPKGGIIPSITEWCRIQSNIIAIISCVGPWQLELEIEIDTFRNLCNLLSQLKDKFSDVVKSYETLLITKEGNFELDLIDKIVKMGEK